MKQQGINHNVKKFSEIWVLALVYKSALRLVMMHLEKLLLELP